VRNAGRPGAVGYAISAVDVALWDLKARLLDLPLHRLLGAVREQVPVYGSGGFTTYDEAQLHEQLTHWVDEQQIPRVKIKIGESWGGDAVRDLRRMTQARRIIGADVELFVDANGGYGRKQAIRVMHAAADLDVRWFEEPVSSDDLDGLREVRDAVWPDVTAGEYGYDVYYFRRMCAAGAVDCLQADVSRCGGITEWLRVSAIAASFGLQVSSHCGPSARPRRGGHPELAPSGVVPRPRSDRVDVLRRDARSHWWHSDPRSGCPGARPYPAQRRRGAVPRRLAVISRRLLTSCSRAVSPRAVSVSRLMSARGAVSMLTRGCGPVRQECIWWRIAWVGWLLAA